MPRSRRTTTPGSSSAKRTAGRPLLPLPTEPDAASRLARSLSSGDEAGLLSERPSSEETMPQFGTRFLVPVHSGFAQDAAVSLAMSPDGLITKLQLQSVSALSNSITA